MVSPASSPSLLPSLQQAATPLLRLPPTDPHSPLNAEFSEICACCQGVPDIDEAVGCASIGMGRSHERHGGHAHTLGAAIQAPEGHAVRPPPNKTPSRAWQVGAPDPLHAVTCYFGLIGASFGWQNVQQANHALIHLRGIAAHIQRQSAPAIARGTNLPSQPLHTEANWRAYADTVAHSDSMQRFVRAVGGYGAMANALSTIVGTAIKPLEPLGTFLLAGYCVGHLVRYMAWERPRLQSAARQQPQHAQESLAARGEAHAVANAKKRLWLFGAASVCFGVYALGALAMTAYLMQAASGGWALLGASLLVAGSASTTFLNNGPVKDTFGKTCDWNIERAKLGSMPDVLLQLGLRQEQAEALKRFVQRVHDSLPSWRERQQRRGLLLADAILAALATGLPNRCAAPLHRQRAHLQERLRTYAPRPGLHPFGLGIAERMAARFDAVKEGAWMAAALLLLGFLQGPLQRAQHHRRHRQLAYFLREQPHAVQQSLAQLQSDLRSIEQRFAEELATIGSDQAQQAANERRRRRAVNQQAALHGLLSGHDEAQHHDCHHHDHAEDHHSSGALAPEAHGAHALEVPSTPSDPLTDALSLLHALSFKFPARLQYEIGALTDHAQARWRLGLT